ncbi:macrolide transport system ATP-binding/permease protein [Pullulanibacillus pueri]|uniref:Msr family ABC-F type ribosomal protection protein n=1 Tax=Pullulanibacillus pueri TaxID=1437324 RepID=A0A8J3ELW4_9BACL|nr:ABC-F type ribosomal protection protein [Pullulanibacillus pueri]MBM7682670.1 macrolide transport system ATP-binding/permease protein [Pullulanibacillus pueri]GGH82728.1 Msr family ABC-F type ribosomal protection protein [Pullulanibacillus pueri]
MENVCIELENVEVSFLDRLVLDIPRLAVYQFDRIGIVGKNGTGKSTLLKLMGGKIKPEKGSIKHFMNFAYFDQLITPEKTEVDYDLKGKLSLPDTEIENFSGGEQTRLKLAQIFSNYHEGLLIDEPTTHLDAEGIQFFIEELTYYYGALIIVSHDRYLLDNLVTKIWEVEGGIVTEYTGNYSEYVAQKELQKRQHQEQHDKYVKEKSRLMKAAEAKMKKAEKITQANGHISKKEAKAKANKMFMTKSKDTSQKAVQRAAKAIEQRVEQLEAVEAPKEEEVIRFHQSGALQLHNKFPIMADQLMLKAGEKTLLDKSSFQFPLGKTIAITGKNGSGKTTLLRHILQRGDGITISPKAVIGIYEQMDYQFTKDETVLEFMKDRSDYDESKIRSVLHSMSFTGNDLKKNVCNLSGGEAIRIVLCQLFLGRYNILVLDEPTNFLDVFCIEALERFLKGYEGTVLFVSHDQTFVERVADCVYVIEEQKLVLRS